MTLSDPISDFLTRIRNASMARKKTLQIPSSNMKKSLAEILKQQNFIENFTVETDNKQGVLKLQLKYEKGVPAISGLERISKPGLRRYADKNNLPKVLNGLGVAVISTSKGLLTDKQAKNQSIGGEVICYIW